jgi:hypothetical protein
MRNSGEKIILQKIKIKKTPANPSEVIKTHERGHSSEIIQ